MVLTSDTIWHNENTEYGIRLRLGSRIAYSHPPSGMLLIALSSYRENNYWKSGLGKCISAAFENTQVNDRDESVFI